MKNITSEQIDDILNDTFIEQNKNVLNDFANNYETCKRIFGEGVMDNISNAPPDYVERFASEFSIAFASFKLAQDNCVEILRKTLKEILCED